MPNIEIHGFSSLEADDLKIKIDKAIQSVGLGGDAITSIQDTCAQSCDGKKTPMPYIRVCSTDAAEIAFIIYALKNINLKIDTEWLVLNGFIYADKMCE